MQQQEEERMKEALKHPDWPTYSNEVERPSEQGRSRRDKGKKDKAQAPKFQMPKVEVPKIDVKSKLTSLNESIKNTKMPTANEIKVKVHRSFHQPLAVRTRVESTDMQQAREMLTKHRTPAELSHLNHPLDIPLPKIRMPSKSKRDISEDETKSLDPGLLDDDKFRLYHTLPKSWRQQNLVTSSRQMTNKEELEQRKELVKTKTPSQLAQFSSITDFPIPSKLKAVLSPSERKIIAQRQRRMSATTTKEVVERKPWTLSAAATIPKAWKDTKLVTNTREDLHEDEARRRRELTTTKSPKELAQFHGISDIPVPSKITNLFKKSDLKSDMGAKSKSENNVTRDKAALPSSWKNQRLVTKVKVEVDNEELEKRRAMTTSKTPSQLAQMSSIQDIPIPATLQRLMHNDKKAQKAGEETKTLAIMKNKLSQSWSNLSVGGDKSGWTLPKSLNAECRVRTRVEDRDVQAARAKTVKNKTVAELAHIGSISDIPIPSSIQHLLEPSRRTTEVAARSQPKKLDDYIPQSLRSELLVSSKTGQDSEEIRTRQELVRSKTPTELSQLHSLSDIPIPKIFKGNRPASQPLTVSSKSLYDTLPRSLKTEVLVRAKVEEPGVQQERAQTVKAKSVNELSQIHSFEEFPLPRTMQNLVGRGGSRPVERKKRFREM
jgi:hypothetical protein